MELGPTNYIVADPNEVWLYEEYQIIIGLLFVYDDSFVVEGNSFRIADFFRRHRELYV
jgi:hypothetical protein